MRKDIYHGGHGGVTEATEESHLFILKNSHRMILRQHAAAARCVPPGIVEAIARITDVYVIT
jgi:hypothetical protein